VVHGYYSLHHGYFHDRKNSDISIEALTMLRGELGKPPAIPPDRRIILLDLNMPEMNGLEFLRQLRSDASIKHIPVVVFTTSNEERNRIETYGFNIAGYILKLLRLKVLWKY
jgi:CheY-like chemotaxis protein